MKERDYEGESEPGYNYRVLGKIRDNAKTVANGGRDVFYAVHHYPHGRIVCTCGSGAVTVERSSLTFGNSYRGCSHLLALFDGRVTEDRELSKRSYYAFADLPRALPYVELTEHGKKFFGWRWAAKAMEST